MKHKVFLVEDDPAVANLVRDVVVGHGWEFEEIGTCTGAIQRMRQFKPDLILLDVTLPDGDGFEICRDLRRDPVLTKTPALFLTGKGDVKHRLKGFESGGQDYIAKPFDVRELDARMCAHLDIKREKDDLVAQKEELLVRDRLRQEMLDMLMHDLRAPLTTLRITLEWVRVSGLITQSEYEVLLKNAESVADWALFMISDVLDLHSGRLRVEAGRVNLRQMAERLKSLFEPQLKGRNIALILALPKDEPSIQTDALLLTRMVANLLSNAAKFTPTNTGITLAAKHDERKLRIEVQDEGPGVPDAEKERIFEKHYRSKSAQSLGVPGVGLGLAFCHFASEALGGRVWVEDAPKRGSRFIIELPNIQGNGKMG